MYKTVKPTTFTLPLALLEELDILAKELGRKKTSIVSSFHNSSCGMPIGITKI